MWRVCWKVHPATPVPALCRAGVHDRSPPLGRAPAGTRSASGLGGYDRAARSASLSHSTSSVGRGFSPRISGQDGCGMSLHLCWPNIFPFIRIKRRQWTGRAGIYSPSSSASAPSFVSPLCPSPSPSLFPSLVSWNTVPLNSSFTHSPFLFLTLSNGL